MAHAMGGGPEDSDGDADGWFEKAGDRTYAATVVPGQRGSEAVTDGHPGVVKKVGFPAGDKRPVLSGGFGTAHWSHDYTQ